MSERKHPFLQCVFLFISFSLFLSRRFNFLPSRDLSFVMNSTLFGAVLQRGNAFFDSFAVSGLAIALKRLFRRVEGLHQFSRRLPPPKFGFDSLFGD